MLGDFLIAIAALILLCLHGSGDHTGPHEAHPDTRKDDDLFGE